MLQAVFAVRRRLLDRRGAKRQMAHSCFRRRRAHLRQGWTSSPSVRSDTRCGGARSLAAAGAAGPWRTAGGLAPTSQPWRARGRGRGKQEGREGGRRRGREAGPGPTGKNSSRLQPQPQQKTGRGARARRARAQPPPRLGRGGGVVVVRGGGRPLSEAPGPRDGGVVGQDWPKAFPPPPRRPSVQEGRRLTWAWSRG
ncbi:unnamed protein product [Prorocentrum cordatum]|uniref:Uncharacterized protein n=1 Tax=Prorocentrum cordatum TaxID=2364126 RepID=A0ABN9SLU9_9DINO|nr:unnamed protein product [Polarella glacialis]